MTDGGILLPGQSQRPPQSGTVVGTGPGLMKPDETRYPMYTKPGDRVWFTPLIGDQCKITIDNQDYFVFDEQNVLGYITKDELEL